MAAPTTIQLLVFLVITALLTAVFRQDLRQPRRHGFPRFFAFEALSLLVILNLRYWFRDPFTIPHLFSWLALTLSGFLVVWGFVYLVKKGQPGSGIDNTTVLVQTGPYKFIRHPLYGSALLLGLGVYLKDITLFKTGLVLVVILALIMTALFEEKENRQRFGPAYQDYTRRTKMFIPFLL